MLEKIMKPTNCFSINVIYFILILEGPMCGTEQTMASMETTESGRVRRRKTTEHNVVGQKTPYQSSKGIGVVIFYLVSRLIPYFLSIFMYIHNNC